MRRFAVVAALAGCHAAATDHVATPPAGISIALYDPGEGVAYGVVDDRRWVAITAGHPIVLDHIDPGAALPSLVIESLAGPGPLPIGVCTRQSIEPPADAQTIVPDHNRSPLETEGIGTKAMRSSPHVDGSSVACELAAGASSGRYLIRVLYVSTTLGYRARHDVVMTRPDHATVTSRFAIVTSAWHERGEVTLFDGLPGGERPPREVARGPIELDGSTAVLVLPTRDVVGHLRRIYDGAVFGVGVPPTDVMWNHNSHGVVWVWLELEGKLAPGPVRAHVELPGEAIRDLEIAADAQKGTDSTTRLALWQDPDLRGMRQPSLDYFDRAALADRMVYSITNLGSAAHEVWIEEHLRPAKHRRVVRAWPTKPAVHDEILRTKLTIQPGKIERVGYTVDYEF